MSAPVSVLGCAGLCWVGFSGSAQAKAAPMRALRALCRVCWVAACGRVCAGAVLQRFKTVRDFSLRDPKQPSTLSTHSTKALKVLIYKGFECAGFVLGWAVSVLGSVFGEVGHD